MSNINTVFKIDNRYKLDHLVYESTVFKLGTWSVYTGLKYSYKRIYIKVKGFEFWTPFCKRSKRVSFIHELLKNSKLI